MEGGKLITKPKIVNHNVYFLQKHRLNYSIIIRHQISFFFFFKILQTWVIPGGDVLFYGSGLGYGRKRKCQDKHKLKGAS